MRVNVRLSTGLAPLAGNPRLQITLTEDATVADLLFHLQNEYPALAQRIDNVIPMIAGRHVSPADPLTAGQEVALLLPVAGGSK